MDQYPQERHIVIAYAKIIYHPSDSDDLLSFNHEELNFEKEDREEFVCYKNKTSYNVNNKSYLYNLYYIQPINSKKANTRNILDDLKEYINEKVGKSQECLLLFHKEQSNQAFGFENSLNNDTFQELCSKRTMFTFGGGGTPVNKLVNAQQWVCKNEVLGENLHSIWKHYLIGEYQDHFKKRINSLTS